MALQVSIAILLTGAAVSLAAEGVPTRRVSKHGLLDITCDSRIKVVIIGDSVVYGRGDINRNNRGGYVARLADSLPKVSVFNQGKPGVSTSRLLTRVSQDIARLNSRGKQIKAADYIIIDVGRNDFFEDRSAPNTAVRLKRVVNRLKKHSKAIMAIALLTPTKRDHQRPFIEQINLAYKKRNSAAFPVRLDFSVLPQKLIMDPPDGLHPSASGYSILSSIVKSYLRGLAQKGAVKALRSAGLSVASC